jgi:hypothetical protein
MIQRREFVALLGGVAPTPIQDTNISLVNLSTHS